MRPQRIKKTYCLRRDGPVCMRLLEREDEVADEVANAIVARILPPELEHLVDAAEDGLGSFGSGAGIGIGFPQPFQEVGKAGFAPAKISKPAAPAACHCSSVRRLRCGVRPSVATAPNSSHAPMATCSGSRSSSCGPALAFRRSVT